ncbi:ribonucleoside-diphosphate reductase subunit alpha [Actinotalea fermentans]|uniref:Ribonucleoside-diphosphate reductase n=1 Tax=Actinotalea fermentans TaxID=43671 RepID=A0A511YXJ2_9CELL|nr:ribonucleoside-diphosphate reductase subunit alpha [Actinotalea fermentans]KGM15970.1 ribonucleotide-diphosphate reductase subunit alpha [Actinotalea fermentans ATCC 43279 = JCM 9966 = DSM 3133]GEN79911.1 ribonucleoside-diphosphate reductase [Actinotalea fermentans]
MTTLADPAVRPPSAAAPPAPDGRIHVTKRDGSREPYDADRINRAIERATTGLADPIAKVTQIASELAITLFDGITSEQLDEAAIAVTVQNVKDDPAFDTIAARLLRKVIYKRVLGGYRTDVELALLHRARFPGYVRDAVEDRLLDARLAELFDLDALAAALDPGRDELLRYIGTVTMTNRYMITGRDRKPLEVPQYFWMRVAMGLSLNEADPTATALALYDAISRLEYLPAGSTLVNAGTAYPQLSNCFVIQMDDDIEHIATSVRNVMWLTKGTGGIGLSVTKLRSEGSPIRSNNTVSTGPIPFMHTIDSTLRAISRGGKKFGALCFYMENWHLDFGQFLDLRQNSGDPYRRTRTANTAVWISDEFMKRVAADEDWYLFDPAETPDLVELTGAAFSARYAQYVADAEAGRLRTFGRVRAREQYKQILVTLQTTSHPWLTWKDTINTRALNTNTGTIHLSNLCTEICLPQDRDTISVCNLASINLPVFLADGAGAAADGAGDLDWERMARAVRLAVRQLDNLIDITISSVPESERANADSRAVGLGMMGFTDIAERLGLAYDSPEAADLIDRVVEFVSWHAIDASADLAAERGAYPAFEGSGWSRGLVPFDTLAAVEADRGVPVEVDRTTRLDWDALRTKVSRGMRNSTLMAIAPTASIGLVAGTTPGLDPQFSQIFSRATSSGKFLEVNRNLVTDLQRLGLWENVRERLLAAQGDLSAIDEVPEHLKAVYRTSFQLSPYAFLEVAARAQKWIDQAISRNIYLADRSVDAMTDLYATAWRKGVKTTYYLHMMPRHTAEQSTVRVNKTENINATGSASGRPASAAPAPVATGGPARTGFAGFGAARKATTPSPAAPPSAAVPAVPAVPSVATEPPSGATVLDLADTEIVDGVACPVDPMERLQCESCQ